MKTENVVISPTGTFVASGSGAATVTVASSEVSWAIGDSNSVAPSAGVKHQLKANEDRSMSLETGEFLWLFGDGIAAVTAAVPTGGVL